MPKNTDNQNWILCLTTTVTTSNKLSSRHSFIMNLDSVVHTCTGHNDVLFVHSHFHMRGIPSDKVFILTNLDLPSHINHCNYKVNWHKYVYISKALQVSFSSFRSNQFVSQSFTVTLGRSWPRFDMVQPVCHLFFGNWATYVSNNLVKIKVYKFMFQMHDISCTGRFFILKVRRDYRDIILAKTWKIGSYDPLTGRSAHNIA